MRKILYGNCLQKLEILDGLESYIFNDVLRFSDRASAFYYLLELSRNHSNMVALREVLFANERTGFSSDSITLERLSWKLVNGSIKLRLLTEVPQQLSANENEYDALIQKYVQQLNDKVAELNKKYAQWDSKYQSNFSPLDWRWIKAMIFLETQGSYTGKDAWRKNEAWQYDPMQVANQGDFALDTIRTGKENTDLLSTQTLPNRLAGVKHTSFKNGSPNYSDYGRRKETEKMTPELSIETGVIWLFRKAISKVDVVSVPKGEQIFSYTVQKGDSYSKISSKMGTTVTELEIQNGKDKPLKIDEVLKYRKASIERRISSWKSWSQTIQAYNSKDGYYERVNTYYQKLMKGAPCFGVKK